ncbi:MAG: hypothetical protein M1383_03955 [Patescibacteria group bacterium]|nr:hypothetical protein [Patescibacteria group bacterium]
MIQDIIDSKTNSTILSFFLVAPERSFSVLEVSKRLGIPHARAGQALGHLSNQGVLKGFSKRGKRYYLLNNRHKLMPEIRKYLQKQGPKYQDELFSAIKKLGKIRAAFLSGIFTGYPNLPVDLLLVGKVNLNKLDMFLRNAQKLMGLEINYSIMTVEEFLLRRDTFDKFIKDIFDYRHIAVVDELGGKKKR